MNTGTNIQGLRRRKWQAVISIAIVVALLAGIFWGMGGTGLFLKPAQAAEVNIVALNSDRLGIEIDTEFLLSSNQPLAKNEVQEALKIEPQFDYSLDKMDGGKKYKIIPLAKLDPNKIYTLSYDQDGSGRENMSWAFQTKSKFHVVRSLPANQTTNVPINTGIEITFSHDNFDLNTAKDYFSISPQVKGSWEKHKKTLVFVPDKLEPATIYQVVLQKDLALKGTKETLAQEYAFSFETAPLQQETESFVLSLDTALTEFSTTEKPVFPVHFYGGDVKAGELAVHIDLYRYPGYQEFKKSLGQRDKIPRWSYLAWNQYQEELNPAYKIAGYDTKLLSADTYTHYLAFPQTLQPGYYAAEFSVKDCVRQVWFQVSDLAVYLSQGTEKSLFWAHNLQTKSPAAGVEVVVESKGLVQKGDDTGVVLVDANLFSDQKDYALVRSADLETLVPLESRENWMQTTGKPQAMDYWKYFYLDRELYKPGDTVNFWGVVSARGKDTPPIQEVILELWGTDGPYYEGAQAAPIQTQRINIQDKIFTGQIKLPILKPGYYYLQIKADGDIVLISRGFSVETYQKPSYKLSLTQDKRAVFRGDKVNFLANTSFFEGTPVPDLKLDYFCGDKSGTVTTNQYGEAEISCTGYLHNEHYNPYGYVSLGVNALLPEAGEIFCSGEFYVFQSQVYLTGQAQATADGYTLEAKLFNVDLTAINNGHPIAEEHFLKGPVVQSRIKASLYQEIWTPVETGRHYDFISKQVVPTYYYEYSTKHLEDFELTTDADGAVKYSGQVDNAKNSYYLELTAQDSHGRQFIRRIQIGGLSRSDPNYQYYYLQNQTGKDGFKPGEEVEVTLMVNDQQLLTSAGSILYYRGQSFIESYQVSNSSQYGFSFITQHIPNVNVGAIYFDGLNYYEASPLAVGFDRKTKALDVKIHTDKSAYRPGEKVKLDVQVTDANRKPVKDASINLNLVDEALFSLRDQNVNFLNSLYGDYYYLFQRSWRSHDHPFYRGGAEQGGEGAGERQDFRDTVLFATLQTDSRGQAAVEFELPDNLTSWRVTYHAFTSNLEAGSGTVHIPVKLPFFMEIIHNPIYLAGDSPVVMLRSFGEKLTDGQEISYNLRLTDPNGVEQTYMLKGRAFQSVDLKLPVLQEGKYTLHAVAQGDKLQDSIIKEFTVRQSFQERTVTRQELLTDNIKIMGSPKQPTDLIFCDYEKSQYLRGLYQLAWNNGSRLEQALAAHEAGRLLNQYFPDEGYISREDQDSLLSYQQPDGGLSILPYAESELGLSAMVAVNSPEVFDSHALAGYFYSILESQKEDDRSLALLGLAALKQPVLLQINDYLQEPNLEPEVKINLALALLEIGDGAYAEKVYRELRQDYAEDLGAVTRIKVAGDQDDIVTATSQMAMLAARLDQPEKHELYQYLLENPGQDILNTVEQVQILKYNLKYMKNSPVSFTYNLNGSQVTKTLQGQETFKLTLLPADIPKISFNSIEGKVGVITKYAEAFKAGKKGLATDLELSRHYMVNGQTTKNINRTDLVKVVINYNIGDRAPNGIYEVVDVLPTGLSYISRPYEYKEKPDVYWNYPSEVKGQKLTFLVSKDRHQITYLARVNSPGEFICEAPLLSNIKNSTVYTGGSQDRIVIK
ncbi:MAG: alpha-2-macroglobulin [Peptococcaceae bacterium]|nr:alpha-2-macroglobulin [Peptococcaceae bacterium]